MTTVDEDEFETYERKQLWPIRGETEENKKHLSQDITFRAAVYLSLAYNKGVFPCLR